MKKITLKLEKNGNIYKEESLITDDDYLLLKRYNPSCLFPGLVTGDCTKDIQYLSFNCFEVEDCDDSAEINDTNKVIRKLKKTLKMYISQEFKIAKEEMPTKDGYYEVFLNNALNPFNERREKIYYSKKDGWKANKDEELSYSWNVKLWTIW